MIHEKPSLSGQPLRKANMSEEIKILVVEDNVTTRLYIKRILKKLGYEKVMAVDDGETALMELKLAQFNLIISDWDMPNLNGLDFLKTLRQKPKLRNIPFLMVTAEKEVSKIQKALKLGADNYVVKPFQPGHLKRKITELLKGSPGAPNE